MPRAARLDSPGLLQHVMDRGMLGRALLPDGGSFSKGESRAERKASMQQR
jgi:hypothetical protein